MSRTQLDEAVGTIEAVTITEFKEQVREVIDLVAECRAIAILRHKTPEAVLIPVDDYIELVKLRRERLNVLTQRYDDMISRMQTPDAAAGGRHAWNCGRNRNRALSREDPWDAGLGGAHY